MPSFPHINNINNNNLTPHQLDYVNFIKSGMLPQNHFFITSNKDIWGCL